jgi:phosphopantetheinyl transferase
MPEVSVAHVAGEALAIAAPPGIAVGVDFELTDRANPADLLAGGFSDTERAMIAASGGSVLRAWCAKEAAAKCLGTGFDGAPLGFTVTAMSESGALVDGPDYASIRVVFAERAVAVLAVAFV